MRRLSRTGDSKLGCFLWLALIAVFGLICYKALPVKLHATQLYDYMDEQAQFAARASPEVLKSRILRRAQELQLPVSKKQILVEKHGGIVRMRCTFTVPIEFPGYTYNWDFDLMVDRKVFLF